MYEQKMCYIDLYRNGVKCGNMGHVRMEWDGERYRFGASLCHMERQTLVTAVLERTGGRPRTTIQNIAIIHGKGSVQLDWMPLLGNEDCLLFQASGEVYGVCRLPRMKQVEEPENAETAERVIPERTVSLPETAPHAGEKAEEKREAAPHAEEKRKAAPHAAGETEEKVEAVSRPSEKTEEKVEAVSRPSEKAEEKREAASRTADKAEEKTEAASQNIEDRDEEPGREPRDIEEKDRIQDTDGSSRSHETEKRGKWEQHITALSDDKWRQLCNIYPIVHPIGDDVEFIKITPADFVVLRQEYQNLVRNSFLLHGYYNYGYILLGKYPDKYYIGVPGIMHEQERIAAAMFGFVGFERAQAPKEQKENKDQFGYYMMEVGI